MSDDFSIKSFLRNRERFGVEEKMPETKRKLKKSKKKKNFISRTFNKESVLIEAQKIDSHFENKNENINGDNDSSTEFAINSRDNLEDQQQLIEKFEQIPLELNTSRKEVYYKIKRRLSRLEVLLEIMPFWKNFLNIFSFVLGITTSLIVSILFIRNFEYLNAFFYNSEDKRWEIYDKTLFIIVPIFCFAVNIVLLRLNIIIYNFDKKLVNILNVSTIIINGLFLIAIIQLLNLAT